MKTFQKPLTAAEERLCLRRCQEGDPEAKRILIERNLRLVAHVAKKYQGNGEELEDLISIGTIGLIKAISTFNSERSARLSTYAARCIDNELLMMLRARKKCSREVSLYDYRKSAGGYRRRIFYPSGYTISFFFYEGYPDTKRIPGHLLSLWTV